MGTGSATSTAATPRDAGRCEQGVEQVRRGCAMSADRPLAEIVAEGRALTAPTKPDPLARLAQEGAK